MTDNVNRPSHYAGRWSNSAEVIDIAEHLNFNRGNAVKYIARAGVKDPDTEIEDLKKAQWYLEREIYRLESAGSDPILDKKIAEEEAVPAGDLLKHMLTWQNPFLPPVEPRVWDFIRDVPEGIRVVDSRSGAYWWGASWRSEEWAAGHVQRSDMEYGPFTEKPLEIQ